MATITEISASDKISDSRAVINTNFSNLNTDKAETASPTLTTPTLTSPVINTGISGTAFLDEDDMASDSATKVASQQSIKAYVLAIASQLNPIGTIREFTVSTNPATLLGFGTWSAHGTGRVTVAIDAGQTEFDTLGETGGEKTHQLTEAELATHDHDISQWVSGTGSSEPCLTWGTTARETQNNSFIASANAGSGTAHNNLQPYIVVYRWERTA